MTLQCHATRRRCRRAARLAILALLVGCAAGPRPDPLGALLEPGERIELRVPAELQHGHDMEEPPYDALEGYRKIETYRGELVVSDRRLLFMAHPTSGTPNWVSIPFAAIARARPSRTPLLHYLVVWDTDSHPDSFVVDHRDVEALHRVVGRALMHLRSSPGGQLRRAPEHSPARPASSGNSR